jgi:hypothetical protein
MFTIMFGLCNHNLARNRLHDAAPLAERILELSHLMKDKVQQAAAHSNFGSICLWRGEFGAAREHLEAAIAVYDRDIPRFLPMPHASVVPSRSQISWVLWMMATRSRLTRAARRRWSLPIASAGLSASRSL